MRVALTRHHVRWSPRIARRVLPALVLMLPWAPPAVAQTNLGEVVDAGATPLTADEFRLYLVGHVLVGPSMTTGGTLEMIYLADGTLTGSGSHTAAGAFGTTQLSGTWKIDGRGRICTTMRLGGGQGMAPHGVALPSRCQVWFRYQDRFVVSDSDTDRRIKVLVRTIKK
jgi:hypothetical protein